MNTIKNIVKYLLNLGSSCIPLALIVWRLYIIATSENGPANPEVLWLAMATGLGVIIFFLGMFTGHGLFFIRIKAGNGIEFKKDRSIRWTEAGEFISLPYWILQVRKIH